MNWQTDISEQRTVVFEFKESSNKSTNLKTLEELSSKLTEFTEELVKSSQKFPSNLKRSKETSSVKLETNKNIAFKLQRFKKTSNWRISQPRDQNRPRKLRAGNFCQIKKQNPKSFKTDLYERIRRRAKNSVNS